MLALNCKGWKTFKKQWTNYTIAAGIEKTQAAYLKPTFLAFAGADTLELLDTLKCDDTATLLQIFEILDSHFAPMLLYDNGVYREKLMPFPITKYPWQRVGCDKFGFGKHDYPITVDYYSDYFEVDRLTNKTAEEMHMARHGICEELVSDNGQPFGSY